MLDFVAAMEGCSVRDAAVKLREWFQVGEPVESSVPEKQQPVQRGIYRDQDGKLYEVIGAALDKRNKEVKLVYRALFGDYRLEIDSVRIVEPSDEPIQPHLEPVKLL